MSYIAYSVYKPSGIPWLGDIPESWQTKRIQYVARLRSGDFITTESIEAEGSYPVFGGNGFRGYTDNYTHKGNYVLIGRQGALCGNINYASGTFWASEHALVAHPLITYDYKWLGYLLESMNLNQYSVSAAQPGLSVDNIAKLKVPFPHITEQQAITSFLDAKTAEIDALIAKKEALLALLAEQRTAVITQAVTKGLNPDTPTKPSGISWLGDIPVGWEVKRLRHIGKPIIGLTYSPEDITTEAEGTLVLRSGNVQNGKISLDDNVYVSTSIPEKLRTRIGDILICSRNGSRALIGKNAKINEASAGQTFGAFMTVLRSEYGDYLYWVFNSSLFAYQAGKFLTTTINQLTTSTFNDIETPFPPKDEQVAIAAFLETKTAELDHTKVKITEAISTLKEYRTALITHAVTGKIKV